MSFTHADSPFNKSFGNVNASTGSFRCITDAKGSVTLTASRNECCSKFGQTCSDGSKVCWDDTCPGGFGAGILAPISAVFNPKGTVPTGKTPRQAVASGDTQVGPDLSTDADCNPWGIFKPLCVAGKSVTKFAEAQQCLPGVLPAGLSAVPCGVYVIGGILAMLIVLKMR